MAVDGTWKIVVQSPMGAQEAMLTLKADGGSLTGIQKSSSTSMDIQDGKVSGDKLTWKGKITQPFPMNLEFAVTVTGDEMKGEVTAAGLGSSPLTGKRVS
ncbi:MAG: hypothetical protein WAW96_06015 [Alphaproteobacteria bacterium]